MDRRIDERLRKPRRTKGTPFYIQRNYWAAGVILLGGFSWFLLDKSKVSASKVESLSHFLVRKSPQKEIQPYIDQNSPEAMKIPAHSINCIDSSDSPYKNLIKTSTEIVLNDSTNDAADFKSPVTTRKPKKLTLKLVNVPIQKSNSRGKIPGKRGQSRRGKIKGGGKNSTIRVITDSFKYFGENPEHMQMALALSKSSYEAECGNQSSSSDDVYNIGDLLRNSKPTFLERFGFTSQRKTLPVDNRRITTVSSEASKKNKNRFKYITPILNIRTTEERNSLIDSKISFILCQNDPESKISHEHAVHSNTLNNRICKERSIFNLDNIYEDKNFYVKCLRIPQNTYKCGHLLKNWNLIPGREKSPHRTVKSEEEPAICKNQDTELPTIPNTTTIEAVKKTVKEIAISEGISQINSINKETFYERQSIKHIGEITNVGPSCLFNISTRILETTSEFNSDYINSTRVMPYLHKNVSTSESIPFNLSSRSISPDLFGDDEITPPSKSNFHQSSFNSNKNAETSREYFSHNSETDINNSLGSSTLEVEDCFKNGQAKIDNSEKNCLEQISLNEVIDLTDDNNIDEYINKSNKSLSSNNEINAKMNVYCASLDLTNQTKPFNTPKINIYNLDEFENTDTIEPGPETNKYSQGISSSQKGQRVLGHNSFVDSKENHELLTTTIIETHQAAKSIDILDFAKDNITSDNNTSSSDIGIINDNDDVFFDNNMYTNNCYSNSHNKSNVNNRSRTSTVLNCNREQIETKPDSSLNDTPKRNYKMSSFCEEGLANENNDCCGTEIKGHSVILIHDNCTVKETPKTCLKSLGFHDPALYDSTDFNVTDYVNNMLDQKNFSFDKTEPTNKAELEVRIVENNEEVPLSQGSQSSVILDEELNYSCQFATPSKTDEARNETKFNYYNNINRLEDVFPLSPESQQHGFLEASTPKNISVVNPELVPTSNITKKISTPNNFVIKTDNVTPMPEYDKMTTPLLNKELQKFGVKPLKRTRGAKLLTYIYESTHPVIGTQENITDISESDEENRVIKRRRKSNKVQNLKSLECNSLSITNAPISSDNLMCASAIEIIGDRLIESEKPGDLIFERKPLTKIASCKVPLQIVWHNLVSSHQSIHEKILLYEPLQLESLHMILKEQGFKFHIQDLLSFLDKKCITIRTAQKQGKIHR